LNPSPPDASINVKSVFLISHFAMRHLLSAATITVINIRPKGVKSLKDRSAAKPQCHGLNTDLGR